MKTYNVYLADDIARNMTSNMTEIKPHGWFMARPMRYKSFINRLKMCWLVLTDQADLVRWFKQ